MEIKSGRWTQVNRAVPGFWFWYSAQWSCFLRQANATTFNWAPYSSDSRHSSFFKKTTFFSGSCRVYYFDFWSSAFFCHQSSLQNKPSLHKTNAVYAISSSFLELYLLQSILCVFFSTMSQCVQGFVHICYSHMLVHLQGCHSATCHGGYRIAFPPIALASAGAKEMEEEKNIQTKPDRREGAVL